MMWNGFGSGGWGMTMMLVSNLLFWAFLLGGGYLLYQAFRKGSPRPDAEQALAQRYARGEIDDDEYHRRLATLRGSAALHG